jgi:integrase
MAHLLRLTSTRWVVGKGRQARRVQAGTPGARKIKALSSHWYAVFTLPGSKKKERVRLARDKAVSQVMLAELLRKRERGDVGLTAPSDVCIGDFCDRYLASRQAEIAPGTYELYERTAKYLAAFFGATTRLASITREQARNFKTALARGDLAHVVVTKARKRVDVPAKPTVEMHVRNAHAVFNQAVADELLAANPFAHLAEAKQVPSAWHHVSLTDFQKLMAAAKPFWRPMLALARWGGLRLEEALELPWSHVDLDGRRLTVIAHNTGGGEGFTPKDKDTRVVPIVPELFALLRDLSRPDDFVVPRGAVGVTNIWRDFQHLFEKAGLTPWAKPMHSLRKSCITDWARTFPMHAVQEWAGHSDIETTRTFYLKVSDDDYRRAAGLPLKGDPC